MATPEARAKILSVSELYTLPQTLVEVLRVADSPESSAYDLSQIILRDAPVTARLLKMANSAMYGRSGQVKTVHQAVVLLGFRSVKSVVLSTSVYDIFGSDKDSPPVDLNQFWLHSLECATTAQLLAPKVGQQSQEEAFVAGLLHDIGILLMGRAFGQDYGEFLVSQSAGDDWLDAEAEQFGVDHREAGKIVFSEWSLPEKLIEVIACHHDAIESNSLDDFDSLTLVVSLADQMSHHIVEPAWAPTATRIAQKRRVMEKLGLNDLDLTSVDAWVSSNLSDVAKHLEIEIGPPSEIVAKANQRLHELYLDMERLVLSTTSGKKEEMARELLDAICATFSHHINNAATTIMGHSELVELAVSRGKVPDADGSIGTSMKSIQDAVAVVSAVLAELKSLAYYDLISYHDRAKILNIDEQVKQRLSHQRL